MTLADEQLIAVWRGLTPAERKAVADHVRQGRRTDLSRAVIRKLRMLLKARARARRSERTQGRRA